MNRKLNCFIFVICLITICVESKSFISKSSSDLFSLDDLSIENYALLFSDNDANEVDDEPDHTNYAKVARYVVHKSDWASFGTISTLKTIKGFPMVNIISIADSGRDSVSTGNIYFYLTNLDYTAQDLLKVNELTVLLSNDQDLECSKQNIDPMEPTCARIMISGNAVQLEKDSEEFKFATSAFINRHPAANHWIDTHDFYLCKVNIIQVAVLDWYGGPHYVNVDDYFNANLSEDSNSNSLVDGLINTHLLKENKDILESDISLNSDKKIKIHITKDNNEIEIEL